VRSSGERSEEGEEVKSKSITGSHCVVWGYFYEVGEGSLLSKDSANSQSLEGRGGDGDGTLELSLLASWSSCWSPLSHHRLCCQPGVLVGRQPGNGHWLEQNLSGTTSSRRGWG